MTNKKYIVVKTSHRETWKIGVCDNFNEAYKVMETDLKNELIDDDYSEEEIKNEEGKETVWDIEKWSAWFNKDRNNIDWTIIDIPSKENRLGSLAYNAIMYMEEHGESEESLAKYLGSTVKELRELDVLVTEG